MKIIGFMSGTSADGIDAALCEVEGAPPQLTARILKAVTVPYSADQRERILNACQTDTSTGEAICRLNIEVGELFAQVALQLIEAAGLKPQDIDLLGSHGQTVWHDILPDGKAAGTLQIGEACVISERTGITTLSNFRARDIAAGGQGAPLTSYVDWLLLRHPSHWRAVQNIGGMGNVTLLPPLIDSINPLVAFDTGPGNALIDGVVYRLTGRTYDADGALAAQGSIDEEWLENLSQHPFYHRQPPKTTGREIFGTEMAYKLVDEGLARGLNAADITATITMLTAVSISNAYHAFAPAAVGEVILGGGGPRNHTLVSMLRGLLDPLPVRTHEDYGISSDFKEALVFAVLAHESWYNRPATLPAQTGAHHASVLGQITPGANFEQLARQTWGR